MFTLKRKMKRNNLTVLALYVLKIYISLSY